MVNTISSGAIVINKNLILLVKETSGFWSFPKGKVKKKESLLETAKREVVEETGLKNFKYVKKLGIYKRNQRKEDGSIDKDISKEIHMFLFETGCVNLLPDRNEILDAKWIQIEKVENYLNIDEDRSFFHSIRNDSSP